MADERRVIVVEQHVAAAPSTVYAYLTVAEQWARWQGVGTTIDPTPGGIFRMQMANGDTARGEFVELVPDRRVVFTWGWIDQPGIPPGSTVVEIDLEPTDEGTLVRLTHHQLPPDQADLHVVGWRHYVGRLAQVAAGLDPGADKGPA